MHTRLAVKKSYPSLDPHPAPYQHQNLTTSRGSPLVHAYHVWSTCVHAFVSYPGHRMTNRQTERHTDNQTDRQRDRQTDSNDHAHFSVTVTQRSNVNVQGQSSAHR